MAPCRALLEERAALAAGRSLGALPAAGSPAKRARAEGAAGGTDHSGAAADSAALAAPVASAASAAPASASLPNTEAAAGSWDPVTALDAVEREQAARSSGESRLFFGCRHREKDFYYAGQWAAMRATGLLAGAHIAFSRDSESKVYVQHLIRSPALRTAVGELIVHRGAHVYVAGSANKMPQDVQEAIESAVGSVMGGDMESARKWVRAMQQRRKYVCEAWS